jgi:hypothetical protein
MSDEGRRGVTFIDNSVIILRLLEWVDAGGEVPLAKWGVMKLDEKRCSPKEGVTVKSEYVDEEKEARSSAGYTGGSN